MKDHKHYQAAYRAHYNTSFSPEKRAESECKFYDETIENFKQIGATENELEKFEKLFAVSLSAKSRCLSAAITGPSKFPVARAEKARIREMKVTDELFKYVENVQKWADRRNNPEKYTSNVIKLDDKNALASLKTKLEKLKSNHEKTKAANKIISKKSTPEEKRAELLEVFKNESVVDDILKPDFCSRIGFTFELKNNLQNIKQVESRIAEAEKLEKLEQKEIEINGVKVIQNKEEMRLQLVFSGKPASDMIQLLKSKGFKWSPRFMAWQRLLNANCLAAFHYYIKPKL